jgi:pimeloyl-ACP methyl ester carboxylesterase
VGGVDAARIFAMGASEGTLIATEGAVRADGRIAGLILYGLLALNMRDNFRYILTDGAFITYRRFLDTDADGRVTRPEWDTDPRGWRQGNLPGVAWEQLEVTRDSVLTVADIAALQRPFLDGLDRNDFAILDAWSRRFASVALPAGWWQDHFAHPALPTFLSRLDIPVGIFHGEWDNATPVTAVRDLADRMQRDGSHRQVEFHFLDTDHTLNVGRYFRDGTIPAGHQAIFDYVRRVVAPRR